MVDQFLLLWCGPNPASWLCYIKLRFIDWSTMKCTDSLKLTKSFLDVFIQSCNILASNLLSWLVTCLYNLPVYQVHGSFVLWVVIDVLPLPSVLPLLSQKYLSSSWYSIVWTWHPSYRIIRSYFSQYHHWWIIWTIQSRPQRMYDVQCPSFTWNTLAESFYKSDLTSLYW
jgi:hypothetical protein